MRKQLDSSSLEIAGVLTALMFIGAVSTLFLPRVSKIMGGERPVVEAGQLASAVAILFAAVTLTMKSTPLFYLCVVLVGIPVGTAPAIYSLLSKITHPTLFGQIQGGVVSMVLIAEAMGSLLGSFLFVVGDYIGLPTLPLYAASGLMGFTYLMSTRLFKRYPMDLVTLVPKSAEDVQSSDPRESLEVLTLDQWQHQPRSSHPAALAQHIQPPRDLQSVRTTADHQTIVLTGHFVRSALRRRERLSRKEMRVSYEQFRRPGETSDHSDEGFSKKSQFDSETLSPKPSDLEVESAYSSPKQSSLHPVEPTAVSAVSSQNVHIVLNEPEKPEPAVLDLDSSLEFNRRDSAQDSVNLEAVSLYSPPASPARSPSLPREGLVQADRSQTESATSL